MVPGYASIRSGEHGADASVYDVMGTLFEDGAASTWLAMEEDAGRPARLVTLTRVRRPLSTSVAVRSAFLRAAELARAASADNFLRPSRTFERDDELYVVGEYQPGARLSEVLADSSLAAKGLPARLAMRVLSDIAIALQARVHGDVTAGNVLVTTAGTAALVHSGLVLTAALPGAERRLRYKAPEQRSEGTWAARATPAADVFAFGCLAWETLTGEHPFAFEGEPPRFAEVAPADAPHTLVALIERATAREPLERFADMRALAKELELAIRGELATHEDVAALVAVVTQHANLPQPGALPPVRRLAPAPLLPPPRREHTHDTHDTHTAKTPTAPAVTSATERAATTEAALTSAGAAPPGIGDAMTHEVEAPIVSEDARALQDILRTCAWAAAAATFMGGMFLAMIKPTFSAKAAATASVETTNVAATPAAAHDEHAHAMMGHAGHAMPMPADAPAAEPMKCAAPKADCNRSANDGCESDLQKDTKNCGVCAKDCQGGACVEGACQPSVVAKGQNKAAGVAMGGGAVYFTTNTASGSVMKVPAAGGPPQVLATDIKYPDAITLDGDTLYFTTGEGSVMSLPTRGGAPKTLASGQASPSAIATRGGVVYWTNFVRDGAVMKVKAAGGTPEALLRGVNMPCALAVDSDAVYVSSYGAGTVSRTPLAGGEPTVLADKQPFPCAVAVSAKGVFWLNVGRPSGVMHVDAKGGAATSVATDTSPPVGLALGEESVYWTSTSQKGALFAAPLGGGAAKTLVSNAGGAASVFASRGVVYYTNYGRGEVDKVVVEAPPVDLDAPSSTEPPPAAPPPPVAAADAGVAPAAPGAAAAEGGEVTELKIASVGNTMAFNTASMTVKTGTKVKVTFQNVATMAVLVHNWVLVKPGTEAKAASDGLDAGEKQNYVAPNDANVLASTKLAKGGETVEVTFTAPAPGTYPFICTMPGHYIMMKGKFIVTE